MDIWHFFIRSELLRLQVLIIPDTVNISIIWGKARIAGMTSKSVQSNHLAAPAF